VIRRHAMPFGAAVEGGATRFRLWAPTAPEVKLCLERNGRREFLPLEKLEGGWWQRVEAGVDAGCRYGYALGDGLVVPDPASRCNPDDVHGLSMVVNPAAYPWHDGGWRGRPWHEAVVYELHLGAFTPQGTFRAAQEKLDYLAGLGVTAVELMPIADFPGRRNWGYDGVLPFAPDAAYGAPDDLKALVDAAHGKGLMVLLDVVYNHFGPEGNYLHRYAEDFFTPRHHTPWGAAINYDGPGSDTVRDFFVHNALYWLEEFHFDGLRLDAVHAILDDSRPDILQQLAAAVAAGPGKERPIHLVLENDHNAAHYLGAGSYAAQWNDDFHHGAHILLTGEKDGYYADYADRPAAHLGRCLAEGFAWQGESSPYRDGEQRGEPSTHLRPTAFVNFLQNHDQVGNRAFGERLSALASQEALEAATAILLLAPGVPLLFMGEEFGAATPFPFFCDFGPDLARAVTEGRRREFARFARFSDEAARERIPDPGSETTFLASKLDWTCLDQPRHREWLDFHRRLLALRRREIVPRLAGMDSHGAEYRLWGDTALEVRWRLGDGSRLTLQGNLGPSPVETDKLPAGSLLFTCPPGPPSATLPPWSARWFLEKP